MTLHGRPTVAEMRERKGKVQSTMLYVATPEEASAAAEAGIDVLAVNFPEWSAEMRLAAGDCFVQVGLIYRQFCTYEDYLRAAMQALTLGADSIYCCPSIETISRLAAEGVPVVGHAGLIPSKATWTGGFRAVGKTAEEAVFVLKQVEELEQAGAFGVEVEVVPHQLCRTIAERTSLFVISMGSGSNADAQYLFACDVLNDGRKRMPRHAAAFHDFGAEYSRLQRERVAAFSAYREAVRAGSFPAPNNLVSMDLAEHDRFLALIAADKSL